MIKKTKKKAVKKKAPAKKKADKRKRVIVKAHSRKRAKIGSLPNYSDPDAVREIELFIENSPTVYLNKMAPILKNLSKLHRKGSYSFDRSVKAFMPLIEYGMKQYEKEYGSSKGSKWSDLVSLPDRKLLAHNLAIETKGEMDLGNYWD